MKNRPLFLLVILMILVPGVSNAQLGILKKALNKQISNKIDTAADKKAKENNTSAGENSGTKASGRGLFGGKIDIKYNDIYKFTGRIHMQMETYDKKDVMKSDYYTYFNSNTLNAGIEVKMQDPKETDKSLLTSFLFDNDNRCFMMLLEGNDSKTGIISTLPSDSVIAGQAKTQKGEVTNQAVITKTGNSRTIAGYKCDEYKITEPGKDGYSNVWMTKDVKIKADKRYWGKSGMPAYYNYPGFEGAMMLAMDAYDKDNKLAMKMETIEINDNFSHDISTQGYTFMKMNFGQAGKK